MIGEVRKCLDFIYLWETWNQSKKHEYSYYPTEWIKFKIVSSVMFLYSSEILASFDNYGE